MTTSVPTPRLSSSLTLAGVTVALPLVLAAFTPAEIVLPLAVILPFITMTWLEKGAAPRVIATPARCSVA